LTRLAFIERVDRDALILDKRALIVVMLPLASLLFYCCFIFFCIIFILFAPNHHLAEPSHRPRRRSRGGGTGHAVDNSHHVRLCSIAVALLVVATTHRKELSRRVSRASRSTRPLATVFIHSQWPYSDNNECTSTVCVYQYGEEIHSMPAPTISFVFLAGPRTPLHSDQPLHRTMLS
jgi:hypothetical protein